MNNIRVILLAIAAIISAASGGKDLIPTEDGEHGV